MAGPNLPVEVPKDQRQEDGHADKAPVYQTHRGKRPTAWEHGGQPPNPPVPDGPVRYEQD